jgi:methionyl-tRNA synthetase
MGHVLEKVLADVCARWMRVRGDTVRFQIGTDEHGTKIQQTADKEGIAPQELVDRNVPLFRDLYDRLGISYDAFIRTTDRTVHWPTVTELWKRLRKAGVLEKRTYTGLYCSGCERFLTKRDLEDGLCPIHKRAPKEVQEENWFFLLSRESEWLKDLLTRSDGYHIVPEFRAHETLSLIEQGLEDVSFSRPISSLSWGIPVPDEASQVMYVWCDALTNYISGIDIFGLTEGHGRGSKGRVEWWDDAEVIHVIGKDIARFHALIWPAMLRHAGVRMPDRLLIHGFLTSEGEKMSKSLGNVIVPDDVLKRFGGDPDPLRFYLSHEVPVGNDGDFSWKRIEELYNSKLRNQLGNMLNRVLVMLTKENADLSIPVSSDDQTAIAGRWKGYQEALDSFEVHTALHGIFAAVDCMNAHFNASEPWKLQGAKRLSVLSHFAEALRHCALTLLPFIPAAAQRMSHQLNVPYADRMLRKDFVITEELRQWGGGEKLRKDWKRVGEPAILFPPLP